MRIRSVHPVTFIMLLACCLIGCDSAVFDDLSDCPQGVNFHFYSQTPCGQFPDYPSDIRQVRVFAFDEKDDYIPEPLFYRLGMKANNEAANNYQNWLAFEVIPSIRKTGSYEKPKKEASHNIQIPSPVNTAAKILKDTYTDAGVDPKFIAVAVNNLYKESTGYDSGIPLLTDEAHLYDKTALAEKFGISSKSGYLFQCF